MKIRMITFLATLMSGLAFSAGPSRAEPSAALALQMYANGDEEMRKEFELLISYAENGLGWPTPN
jgi:hypothetical protein